MTSLNIIVSILFVFIILGVFSFNDDDEECLKLFKSQTQPRDCCNFPLRFILPIHQEKFKKSCAKNESNASGCCLLDCIYHKTGVVRDLKLNPNALLELYENYLNEKGGGKFDQWMLVVENSIKTCTNFVPNDGSILTCAIPQYALDVMDCVAHFNFINCPKYENSCECEALKKFVENLQICGKEVNGTFIIDYNFFDESK